MSILIFLAVLFVLVLVHELGHFAVAKWTGMRVDEFGIGFPPKLFGIKKGETEYTLNLFPVGGFVRIFGEDSIVNGEDVHTVNNSFTSKNKLAQSAVLVAGVTMNILFAWLLVAIAFGIGVKSIVAEEDASDTAQLTVTHVLPGSPAEVGSLPVGAVIQGVTVGEQKLSALTPSAFSTFVGSYKDVPLTIIYTYSGELRMVQIIPTAGVIAEDAEKSAVGIALAQIDTIPRSFIDSVSDSFVYVVTGLHDITLGIGNLVFDAVRFKADFSQVAGPIGIVGLVGEASAFGLTSLLMFTAFISLNLAVINILPFPALDGGRLLFVVIEAVKGSAINSRYVAVLNTAGFLLLITLMIAVTWNDIVRML